MILEKKMRNWVEEHYSQVAFFNIFLIFMFLLRSAGYFDPYFVISVNFIVLASLMMALMLFRCGSRPIFIAAALFWFSAACLKLLEIEVWADRTAIYVYQSLVVGTVVLVIESLLPGKFKLKKSK